MLRHRRARLLRLVMVLINVIAALTSIGVGACLILAREPPPPPPPAPRPVVLPAGLAADFEPFTMSGLPATDAVPPPVRPSAYEDLQILVDAPADFEARYRVILASLELEPAERHCIIERRGSHEWDHQLVLACGDRFGSWLLLAIEPEPTSPRSVRLRFRDLRRGEEIVTVLAPDL